MSDDPRSFVVPGAALRPEGALLREVTARLGRAAMLRRSRLRDPDRGFSQDSARLPGGLFRTAGSVRRIEAGDRAWIGLVRYGAYLAQDGRGAGRSYRALEGALDADDRSHIERARTGRARAPFYDARRSGLVIHEALEPFKGEAAHYRAILSPAAGWELGDLHPLIRETLSVFELSTGARLEWFAVDHHDTPHPHSHIVISARGGDGRDIGFSETSLRRRLQRAAESALSSAFASGAYDFLSHSSPGGAEIVALNADLVARAREGESFRCHQADLLTRLEALEIRSLAMRAPNGRWRLPDDLSSRLQEISAREELEARIASALGISDRLLLRAASNTRHVGVLRGALETDPFADRCVMILETGEGDVRWQAVSIAEAPRLLGEGALIAFDGSTSGRKVTALSLLSLEGQTIAPHLTYLDQVIAGRAPAIIGAGLVAIRFRDALERRRLALLAGGWLRPGEATLRESALRDLARREVSAWTERVRELRAGRTPLAHSVGAPVRLTLAQGEFEIVAGPPESIVLSPASRLSRGRNLED
ncbi:MAG: hypothetical protein KGS00_03100 [Alphaproteobacteria bacterium]|nr:hypothetical protein [Alphaproteobacteria bacterium]